MAIGSPGVELDFIPLETRQGEAVQTVANILTWLGDEAKIRPIDELFHAWSCWQDVSCRDMLVHG
ncbi:MAG TPA: hypothetical protein VE860_19200 [Chthoniobacterales bacterium]|nr:hypothetical protein [Chthoniobacterales bacterium]